MQLNQSSYLRRHSIIGTADSGIGLLESRLKATMISRQPFEHFLWRMNQLYVLHLSYLLCMNPSNLVSPIPLIEDSVKSRNIRKLKISDVANTSSELMTMSSRKQDEHWTLIKSTWWICTWDNDSVSIIHNINDFLVTISLKVTR